MDSLRARSNLCSGQRREVGAGSLRPRRCDCPILTLPSAVQVAGSISPGLTDLNPRRRRGPSVGRFLLAKGFHNQLACNNQNWRDNRPGVAVFSAMACAKIALRMGKSDDPVHMADPFPLPASLQDPTCVSETLGSTAHALLRERAFNQQIPLTTLAQWSVVLNSAFLPCDARTSYCAFVRIVSPPDQEAMKPGAQLSGSQC